MGLRIKTLQVPVIKDISKEDKDRLIREFTTEAGRQALALFMMLDLKTHIECMIVNDFDGKEYVLSFKTLDRHMADRQP